MKDVESAAHDLILAADQMTDALDAIGDDRLACQYVPIRTTVVLEFLAERISSGQKLE
jgi:hypothetical protein